MNKFKVLKNILKKTGFLKVVYSFILYLALTSIILVLVEPKIETIGDSIWYCIITSTTTGYGDIVVSTTIGRILSVILILYGMLFFGCLSGIVVSYYLEVNKA